MSDPFVFYPLGEEPDERDRVCGHCYYSEPSFNLMWCNKHEKKVIFTDSCGDWTSDKCKPKNHTFFDDQWDDWIGETD